MLRKLKNKIKQYKWGRILAYCKNKNFYKAKIREHLTVLLEAEPEKKWINWCYKDFLDFYKRHGCLDFDDLQYTMQCDYFGTQMFRKSEFVRAESFATPYRKIWRDRINDKKYWSIFDNKKEFNLAFSEYLHRPWMAANNATTLAELQSFCTECDNKVFAKDPWGCGGHGVQFYDTSDISQFDTLYKLCMVQELVLEGNVNQCEELFSFSNSSVNTLRIITIVDKNETPHVAAAAFRMGMGGVKIDNFSSGGIASQVDVETGLLYTGAIAKNGRTYFEHPYTKKQIIGYRIPDWESYKKFALDLAMKFPQMHYIGWDIVKDTNGHFVCIEGNREAGADVMESNSLHGYLKLYDDIYNARISD